MSLHDESLTQYNRIRQHALKRSIRLVGLPPRIHRCTKSMSVDAVDTNIIPYGLASNGDVDAMLNEHKEWQHWILNNLKPLQAIIYQRLETAKRNSTMKLTHKDVEDVVNRLVQSNDASITRLTSDITLHFDTQRCIIRAIHSRWPQLSKYGYHDIPYEHYVQ